MVLSFLNFTKFQKAQKARIILYPGLDLYEIIAISRLRKGKCSL